MSRHLAVLTLCTIICAACSPAEDNAGEPAGATIGPAGGTFVSETGVILVVPPGALDAEVTFSITALSENPAPIEGLEPVSELYEIQPHGTEFAVPVSLTIPYNPALVPGDQHPGRIQAYGSGPGGWEVLDAEILDAAGRAQVHHLSLFGLLFGCQGAGAGCQTSWGCCDTAHCHDGICAECTTQGGDCASGPLCCPDLTCRMGTCQPCTEFGEPCSAPMECCGLQNRCVDGTCQDCVSPDGACVDSAQCCTTFLFNVHNCVGGVCTMGCGEIGDGCEDTGDCCRPNFMGHADGLRCDNGTCAACIEAGAPCQELFDCCGEDWCENGLCTPCMPIGSDCKGEWACCGVGDCAGGQCAGCWLDKHVCNEDEECCTGICEPNRLCWACPSKETDCVVKADCCVETCCDWVDRECVGGKCLACVPRDGACEMNEDCCPEDICYNGVCAHCRGGGQDCSMDDPAWQTDCCSGRPCEEGICRICAEDGEACTADKPCCEGPCVAGTCQECAPKDTACESKQDCCGSIELGCIDEVCVDCIPEPGPCLHDDDCCGYDRCLNGICQPCVPEDEPCPPDPEDCCGHRCVDGTCQGCHDDPADGTCGAFPDECCEGYECVDGGCTGCQLLGEDCPVAAPDEVPCCDGLTCLCEGGGTDCDEGRCLYGCDEEGNCPTICLDTRFAQVGACKDGLCVVASVKDCAAQGKTCVEGQCVGDCHPSTVTLSCPPKCDDGAGEYVSTATCVDGQCVYGVMSCAMLGKICHAGQCVDGCSPDHPGGGCAPAHCDVSGWIVLSEQCVDGACAPNAPIDCSAQEGKTCGGGECVAACNPFNAEETCFAPYCDGNYTVTPKCENGACVGGSYWNCEWEDKACDDATGICVTACTTGNMDSVCPPSLCSDDGAMAIPATCVNGKCGFGMPESCIGQGKTCEDGACADPCTPETVDVDCPPLCQGDHLLEAACPDGACVYDAASDCWQWGMTCWEGECVPCGGIGQPCGWSSDTPCCAADGLVCVDDECAAAGALTVTHDGLMWEAILGADEGTKLSEASAYCSGLTLDGHSDWRVPNIDELRSLVDGCAGTDTGGACPLSSQVTDWNTPLTSPACNGCTSGLGPGNDGCYWPAEIADPECGNQRYLSTTAVTGTGIDPGEVWTLTFTTASFQNWAGNAASGQSRVRCVR